MVLAVCQEYCNCKAAPDGPTNYSDSALPVPPDDLSDLDLSWAPTNGQIRLDDMCCTPTRDFRDNTAFSEDYSANKGNAGGYCYIPDSDLCGDLAGKDYSANSEEFGDSSGNKGKTINYYYVPDFSGDLAEKDSAGGGIARPQRNGKRPTTNGQIRLDDMCCTPTRDFRENNALSEGSFANKGSAEGYYHIPDSCGDLAKKDYSANSGEFGESFGNKGNTINCYYVPDFSGDLAEKDYSANNGEFGDSFANYVPDFSGELVKKRSARRRKWKRVEGKRRCGHCETTETPQWREGPAGAKTLCNACGVRYKSGRLVAEYRPAKSPSFDTWKHSNFHKRIVKRKGLDGPDLSYWVV